MRLNQFWETHPIKERQRVKQKGKHEGSGPQDFAPLWKLHLQEPAETKADPGEPKWLDGVDTDPGLHLQHTRMVA